MIKQKKQIVKEFTTVKYVRYLPKPLTVSQSEPPKRILAVGRCLLDMVTVVDEFPTEGTYTYSNEGYWRRSGPAANICTVIRRLGGCLCEFLGVLSNGISFEGLVNSFYAAGIEIDGCPRIDQIPPFRTVFLTRHTGKYTAFEHANRFHELSYQNFLAACDFRKYHWIHFEGRNPKETGRMMKAVRDYNERSGDNVIISVDLLNLLKQSLTLACLADYVFVRQQIQQKEGWMNVHESCRFMREKLNNRLMAMKSFYKKKVPYNIDELPNAAIVVNECSELKERLPVIICANTKEGGACVDANDKFIKAPGQIPTALVDPLVEHDTFCATMIYALQCRKLSLCDSMAYATRAASFKMAYMDLDKLRCLPKDLMSFYNQSH